MTLSLLLGTLCQSPLQADRELQDILGRARDSGQPHLVALSERISQIIEYEPPPDPAVFKSGLMRVLKHADTRKRDVADMYLLLTQQHVVEDILADRGVAAGMAVDGSLGDWPSARLIEFPKQTPAPKLKRFGALRGTGLHLMYETPYVVVEEPRLVYGLEITTLENRFAGIDYVVRISNSITRAYDAEGNEIDAPPDSPLIVKAGPKVVEVLIPQHNIEKNMRSVAVRGVLFGAGDERLIETPWVACPTGPVTDPLQLLIDFATVDELPADSTLPLAIALQEGLLLSRCHPDIADAARADARAWYELATDLDARADLGSFAPPASLPPAAQLVWACRDDGFAALNDMTDYLRSAPTAETLKELGTYARREGLVRDTDVATATARIAAMLRSARVFDWPSPAARAAGAAFVDDRPEAYITRGDERLLCYRDLNVNDLSRMLVQGETLKGSRSQVVALQRALSQAIGIPTLTAGVAAGDVALQFTLSLDGQKKRWRTVGAPPLPEAHPQYLLTWSVPWTRPERFAFWHDAVAQLPEGDCRTLLADYGEEHATKRLSSLLDNGIPHKMVERSILPR